MSDATTVNGDAEGKQVTNNAVLLFCSCSTILFWSCLVADKQRTTTASFAGCVESIVHVVGDTCDKQKKHRDENRVINNIMKVGRAQR